MKIGILTFHAADNYGAVLQAFGLKEVLCQMGHDAHVVDYQPDYLTDVYRPMHCGACSSMRHFIRALSVLPIRMRRHRLFSMFRDKYLSLIPVSEISTLDAVIAGSDQIWNPSHTGQWFDPIFMLSSPLVADIKYRLTYAASAGDGTAFSNSFCMDTAKAISAIDSVSVREQSLADFLSVRGINSRVVLDPVLLAGREVFEPLTSRTLVPAERYVLCFSLSASDELQEMARSIADRKGIRMIYLMSMDESARHPHILQTASVERFLSLIKYADAVVTTSFHGTAFSLLFNRQFLSVGYDDAHSKRASMLLKSVGVLPNLIKISDHTPADIPVIDYSVVSKHVKEMRQSSYEFVSQVNTPPPCYVVVDLQSFRRSLMHVEPMEGLAA